VDTDQAYREIQELVARGIVNSPDKTGRAARYRLSAELEHERRWLESGVPIIRAHFAVQPRWTNTEYREFFALRRYPAVRELKILCERGILEPRGERRGARYVRGDELREK
jgi:predicted HTH transcriptional regulator